jgi:hypothetical protein
MIDDLRMSNHVLCSKCLYYKRVRGSKFCQRCKDEKAAERKRHEIELTDQLVLGGLVDGSLVDYPFDADRNWTFDRAWPERKIALEVDGGNRMAVISKRTGKPVAIGRHTLSADYSKINAATMQGWSVFRFTPEMIRSGEAFATIHDVLEPLPFT